MFSKCISFIIGGPQFREPFSKRNKSVTSVSTAQGDHIYQELLRGGLQKNVPKKLCFTSRHDNVS